MISVELVAFFGVAVAAYVVLTTGARAGLSIWFILFVVYSLIARMPEFPAFSLDMIGYYRVAGNWPPSLSFYTLREPVVWLGAPFVQHLMGSRVAAFLFIDITTALLVVRAMALLDDGSNRMLALSPTIIGSYIFLLGQQNVLRQHVALAIFLLAVASRIRHRRDAYWLFALSVAAHNATFVLFGYWHDVGRETKKRYGPLMTLAGVVLMGVSLPILRKSSSATGIDVRVLYVTLMIATILLVMYAKMRLTPGRDMSATANYMPFVPSMLYLGQAQFERLSMMFLVLMVVDVYRNHSRLGLSDNLVANLAYVILVVPVFIFPTVRVFLE